MCAPVFRERTSPQAPPHRLAQGLSDLRERRPPAPRATKLPATRIRPILPIRAATLPSRPTRAKVRSPRVSVLPPRPCGVRAPARSAFRWPGRQAAATPVGSTRPPRHRSTLNHAEAKLASRLPCRSGSREAALLSVLTMCHLAVGSAEPGLRSGIDAGRSSAGSVVALSAGAHSLKPPLTLRLFRFSTLPIGGDLVEPIPTTVRILRCSTLNERASMMVILRAMDQADCMRSTR